MSEDLVTTQEAGRILGIAGSSVRVYQRRYPDFPQPKLYGNTNLFQRVEVETWRDLHFPKSV